MNFHSLSEQRVSWISVSRVVALVLVLAFCTTMVAPPVWSQESAAPTPSEGGSSSSAGMQAVAGLSNLLYFPAKAVFAICGGIVGGLTYVFSGLNENAAKPVWITSMYGTYIVTPEHLRGDKPIRFLGVADPDVPAEAAAPAPEPAR